jgi:hypothetical protein
MVCPASDRVATYFAEGMSITHVAADAAAMARKIRDAPADTPCRRPRAARALHAET